MRMMGQCKCYAQTFVLQRPKRGGEGLVLSNQPSGMQILETGTSTAGAMSSAPQACCCLVNQLLSHLPTAWAGPLARQRRLPVLLAEAPIDFLDITDYALVEDTDEAPQQLGSSSSWQGAPSECTGMVVHSLFGGQQHESEVWMRCTLVDQQIANC